MDIVYLIGIAIAFFLIVLLASKKKKSAADLVLTSWMILMLVHIVMVYLYATIPFEKIPSLIAVAFPFPLMHSVLLYLYALFLTGQVPRRRWLLSFHFLPALMMYLYLIPFYLLPAEEKLYIFTHRGAGYEVFNVLKDYATILSGIIYVTLTFLLVRKYQQRLQDRYANIDAMSLQWLQILALGMGGIWVLILLFWDDTYIFSGVVLFIFLIGFFGIRQGRVFHDIAAAEETKEEKKKYSRSGLTGESSKKLFSLLNEMMQRDRLYTKSDLSIDDLAERLEVHPNYLSQTVNENAGKNFYDFVNTYRVEEFKRLLTLRQYRNRTLLSVALDCGFNSKSSFNRSFKRATGMTPSAYFAGLQPPDEAVQS